MISLDIHACTVQGPATGKCLVEWTGCSESEVEKAEKERFGSGVSLYQLSWHEDGELARKQDTAQH